MPELRAHFSTCVRCTVASQGRAIDLAALCLRGSQLVKDYAAEISRGALVRSQSSGPEHGGP